MRLIDADALHEALKNKQKWVVRRGDKHNEGYTYDQVHFAIDEAPTIEAVSIDDYRSMDNTCYKLQKALYEMAERKTEPQMEVIMPKKCKGCDSASKIIEAYSRGFEDGAEAVKAVPHPTCKRCKHFKFRPNCGWECEYDTFEECNYEPNSSEIPNNFDKDINVRSKTEPKLSEIPTSKCHYEPKDEPQERINDAE